MRWTPPPYMHINLAAATILGAFGYSNNSGESVELSERQYYCRAAQTCLELMAKKPDSNEIHMLTLRLCARFLIQGSEVWNRIEKMAQNDFTFDPGFNRANPA